MNPSSPIGLMSGIALEAPTPADASIDPSVDWVRRAVAGDHDAFARLVHLYSPRLKTLLLRRLGTCSSEIDDVLQETFTKAYQSLHRYDSQYRFSTWLFTIGIRLAIDVQRRHRRWPWLRASDALLDQCPARSTTATPVQESPASGHCSAIAESDVWQQAQAHLNPAQSTALWLRYAEELSIEEMAKILGKTQIGVRVLLHRARARLLDKIEEGSDRAVYPTSLSKEAHDPFGRQR